MARTALQGVEERFASGGSVEGDGAPPDILVVDDDPGNLAAIEAALGDLGRNLVKAASGAEALRHLLAKDFALILLDVNMPGMDGFETARVIRERPRSRHVPIIFVTAYNREDTELILRGYSLGAVDFLFKPIVAEVLRAKAAVFVELQNRAAALQRQAEVLRAMERREHERRLDEERQVWESQALREENQRKDEFLAVLAHELRNPLSPLVTGLELIKAYNIQHDGLDRVRKSMERQVRHLIRLVDDLLDVSRISRGKINLRLEPIELGRVLHQALESVEPLVAERQHELVVELCDDDLVLYADQVRLTQVVANLLHNAARYTEPNGRIEVSCGRDGGQAVLRVADNGRGIAPQMLDRIFDIFVQEREGGGGLGLGLTLVHRLVQLHGGAVRAYSEGVDHGSEFIVRLPLMEARAGASAPPPAVREDEENGDATARRPLRIVVVDDQDDVRESMQALLEGWGHRVQSAADGKSAIELIVSTRPEVAIVDIGMPGLDGYAVARRVRAELAGQSPRLVALTGYGREEDREKARRAGFDSHLTKPASPKELRRALRSDTDGDPFFRRGDQRQDRPTGPNPRR